MLNFNFLSKKSPLVDPIAEARLDEALNDSGQQFVAQSVKRLPSEDVSLTWRSQLNERLMAEQATVVKSRKQKFVWRPIAGLALASALAFVLMTPRSSLETPQISGVEADVIQSHVLAQRSYELTGSAIVSADTNLAAVPQNASYQWEEADLGAL